MGNLAHVNLISCFLPWQKSYINGLHIGCVIIYVKKLGIRLLCNYLPLLFTFSMLCYPYMSYFVDIHEKGMFSVLHIYLESICALDVNTGWKNFSPHLLY